MEPVAGCRYTPSREGKHIKGTVSGIFCHPHCKDGYTGLTTVPLSNQ